MKLKLRSTGCLVILNSSILVIANVPVLGLTLISKNYINTILHEFGVNKLFTGAIALSVCISTCNANYCCINTLERAPIAHACTRGSTEVTAR